MDKQISGDLTATIVGQMLTAMTNSNGSAGYVAIELVKGVLNGNRGSFVLQHTGIINRGTLSLGITVVPDSGTEELASIRQQEHLPVAVAPPFHRRWPGSRSTHAKMLMSKP
jgi:hypothetical protein